MEKRLMKIRNIAFILLASCIAGTASVQAVTQEELLYKSNLTPEQYINNIIQGKNPAYNQTDISLLNTIKNHYDFIVKNVDRLQIKTSGKPPLTRQEKMQYLSKAHHPYQILLYRVLRTTAPDECGKNSQCIISEMKNDISQQIRILQAQQDQQKWLIPYV